MIAAGGEFNWSVLVVMAVIAFVGWLSNKLQSSQNTPPPGVPKPGAPRRGPAESEEERMRRFLEALGIPSDTAPPPPPRQKPLPPPMPTVVVPPPMPSRPRLQRK